MPDDAPAPKPPTDVVILGGPTNDGEGVRVMRVRDESVGLGEVRPMKDGVPIAGEVVKLRPRETAPAVCDVEVLHPAPAPARTGSGPAKVASDAYRDNWDRVFRAPDRALN